MPESIDDELNKDDDAAIVEQRLEEQRQLLQTEDPISLIEKIYQLWWRWADFELYVISPTIAVISPPLIILPESIPDSDELEYVYPILDDGYRLRTSKAEEMFSAGMSMCKLYFTVEKMIFLLVERLKTGGVSPETEVQIAFGGHQLAQRKAFESIINLNFNVVVTNFDPGPWGERYLQIVKRLADKGYGYPPEAPRDSYRHLPNATSPTKR